MKKLWFIIFLIVLCLPLWDLLYPGLPITHDGQDHVARIANFYQSLSEGNLVPRWAGNLNWGYGHPILMFLYPFPSYFASFFASMSFSFVDSVKLVFGFSFILSGLAMYLWMREETGEFGGIASGLLYTFAPYRFVDLYVRGAIGEHVAFIFPPLILYFLLKLSQLGIAQKRAAWYLFGGALSLAGLILSHNAISLMFLPIVVLYMGYLGFRTDRTNRTDKTNRTSKVSILRALGYKYVAVIVLGFGLSAFFWLPAFFEGKYTLRDIVTAGSITSRFVTWPEFFYGEWSYGGTDYLSKQIGLVQWFIVTAGIVILLRKKVVANKIILLVSVVTLILSLIIMTSVSSVIWQHVSLLSKFQFPWRFLTVSVFAASVVGGYVFTAITDKKRPVLLAIVIATLLISTSRFWEAKDFLHKPEMFFRGIYNSTTDTGESSPIWSVRFMEKRPQAHMEVIDGEVEVSEVSRISTRHEYKVSALARSRLKENTLYFPGWRVLVDGQEVDLQFQDPMHRGIMTFFVEKGDHKIEVVFTETKLRLLANTISLVSLCILGGWLILKNTLWRQSR